jgi:mannose-6-phosphate isomerase
MSHCWIWNLKSCIQVWMGTHPNGPAALYNDPGTSLQSLLSADPAHLLGSHIISKFPVTSQDERSSRRPEIPFLFKVLSIAKALPLQAHPDKALAEKLNARDGQSFVDANHKPEIALALGDFRGFVGFKPLEEIRRAVEETPELAEAVGRDVKLVEKPSLKVAVSALLHRPQNEIEPMVRRLVNRLKSKKDDAVSQLVVEVDE